MLACSACWLPHCLSWEIHPQFNETKEKSEYRSFLLSASPHDRDLSFGIFHVYLFITMHATCCVLTHLITHSSCPFVQDIIKIYQRHPGETSLRWGLVSSRCFKGDCLGHTPRNRPGALSSLCVLQHLIESHSATHNTTHTCHTVLWYFVDIYFVVVCGTMFRFVALWDSLTWLGRFP